MRTLRLILALLVLAPAMRAGEPVAPEPGSSLYTQIYDAVRHTRRDPYCRFFPYFFMVQDEWAIFDAAQTNDPKDNSVRNGCIAATLHRVRGKWTVLRRWWHDDQPTGRCFRDGDDEDDTGPNPTKDLPHGLAWAYDKHFGFRDTFRMVRVPRVRAVDDIRAARLFRGVEEGDRREVIRIDHEITAQPEKRDLLYAIWDAEVVAAQYFQFEELDHRVFVILSPANGSLNVITLPDFTMPPTFWSFDAAWVSKKPDYLGSTVKLTKSRLEKGKGGKVSAPFIVTSLKAIDEAEKK